MFTTDADHMVLKCPEPSVSRPSCQGVQTRMSGRALSRWDWPVPGVADTEEGTPALRTSDTDWDWISGEQENILQEILPRMGWWILESLLVSPPLIAE